jgi:hypothetical protein
MRDPKEGEEEDEVEEDEAVSLNLKGKRAKIRLLPGLIGVA